MAAQSSSSICSVVVKCRSSGRYHAAPKDRPRGTIVTFTKGDALELPEVLAVGEGETLRLGSPLVSGATVKGVVVRETRGPKLIVYKKKKRKGYQRSHGHRQNLVEVRIDSISV